MELYYSVFKTAAGWIAALANTDGLLTNTLPQDTEQQAFLCWRLKQARSFSRYVYRLQKKWSGTLKARR